MARSRSKLKADARLILKAAKQATPRTRTPWDTPLKPAVGNPNKDQIFRTVGAALDQWEFAEQAFADIFVMMVEGWQDWPSSHPALRAYGAVTSFSSRADMIEEAAKGFFHETPDPKAEELFKSAIRAMRGFSGRRNDIAHGRVTFLDDTGYYLCPGLFASRKNPIRGPATYAYSSKEINYLNNCFNFLEQHLRGVEIAIYEAQQAAIARKTSSASDSAE
ncbi:MAG TPA: hypothetical protein VFB63_14670 [Bryobacteraceae bacterium]|nr:hypothetical protein [Bryobacteraceae bacterium]